ncbi:MAG: response regulator transcription factor [Ignavibacteriaceae bacterium]
MKILIADDHPLFRNGLKNILEVKLKDLDVVYEASNGREALELLELYTPEIAIFDVDMPELSGLEAAKLIQKKSLDVNIIILTMYNEEDIFRRAMSYGIKGYVLKESAITDILGCIGTVKSGKRFVSPALTDYLLKDNPETVSFNVLLSDLTASQRKIVKLISESKTTKEIAEELFISPKTVEHHRSNICKKLKLQGPNALLRFAIDNKLRL